MAVVREPSEPKKRRPATTLEGREKQMVAIAFDLAEQQMLDGTASAQVVSHFLKLGSTRERAEQKRIALETELLVAKTNQIASEEDTRVLVGEAIKAMSRYQGREDAECED